MRGLIFVIKQIFNLPRSQPDIDYLLKLNHKYRIALFVHEFENIIYLFLKQERKPLVTNILYNETLTMLEMGGINVEETDDYPKYIITENKEK